MRINAMVVFIWLILIVFASLIFNSLLFLSLLFLSSLVPSLFLDFKKYAKYMLYSLFAVLFIFVFNTILMGFSSLLFSTTMSLRLLSITSAFAIFSLTVDFEHMIMLLEKLKFPQKSVVSLSLSLRFFPVAINDAERIKEAMIARGVHFEKKKMKERIKSRIPMFSSLFLISLERSVQIAEALELRGFPAEKRRVWKPLKIGTKEKILILGLLFDFLLIFYSLFSPSFAEISAVIPLIIVGGFTK